MEIRKFPTSESGHSREADRSVVEAGSCSVRQQLLNTGSRSIRLLCLLVLCPNRPNGEGKRKHNWLCVRNDQPLSEAVKAAAFAAIEPVIGHTKAEHRMGCNYLKGRDGE